MRPPLTSLQILEAVRALGLSDSPVCLHSSLKSFGPVEGGAEAVIRAFLQAGCTLMAPTFTYRCAVAAPPGRQVPQNGYAAAAHAADAGAVAYAPHGTLISRQMGAIPACLLALPGRVRGDHPLNSFAALGPAAQALIGTQGPLNVYGPLVAMLAQPAAWLVLAGVDLTSATPIHLAEARAGRNLFRRWALTGEGATLEVEVGSCSDGFNNLAPAVRDIEIARQVGESRWRVYPFRPFIEAVTEAIVQNAAITHCGDPDCIRCQDAVRGGPRV